MSKEKVFVGREKDLDEFQQFLVGERDGPGGKGAPVLLVVGDRGMGKTALLQAMAQETAAKGHFVIVGEVDKDNPQFSEQIYPLIAMLRAEKKLQLGAGRFWLKIGLKWLGVALGLSFLGDLGVVLKDVREHHTATGSALHTLPDLFHSELSTVNNKIGENSKLVILIDPEKETPSGVKSLLRDLHSRGMPEKVRFVIAQRHKDALKKAVDDREIHRLCAEPMILHEMNRKEGQEFIETHDPEIRLKGAAQEVFWKRYCGWPLLMEMALDEIIKTEEEINEEFIKNLPADIGAFWKNRYQTIRAPEPRILVQIVCLLPHPYPKNRLAKFTDLDPDKMDLAWSDETVWGLWGRLFFYNIII